MVWVEVEVIGLLEGVVEWNVEWELQVDEVQKVVEEWHCWDHLCWCMEVVLLLTGGVDSGSCVGIGGVLGRDFSGKALGMVAETSGTKPDAC